MAFKELVKPSLAKIIIFILLIIATIFIPKQQYNCQVDQVNRGTNCGFFPVEGIGYPVFYGERIGDDIVTMGFHPISFIINIILYYFIASIIVHLFLKIKKQ